MYISQSNNTKYILQFNCEVMQKTVRKKTTIEHFRNYTYNILKRKKTQKSQKKNYKQKHTLTKL